MRIEQLGALRARILGGNDGKGGGDGPVIILMHGFGAPGDDLVPFAGELAPGLSASTRYVFPEAPLEFELGYGYGEARAWWMIDLAYRQQMMIRGQLEELTREKPEGLAEARDKVIEMCTHLEKKLGGERWVIGGFSQGSMVATDVVLHSDRKFSGLVVLSGTLLDADQWSKLAPKRRGLPVFQSHGVHDPLLPFSIAEKLVALLQAGGLEVEFASFPGEHEIPRPVLTRLVKFLAAKL